MKHIIVLLFLLVGATQSYGRDRANDKIIAKSQVVAFCGFWHDLESPTGATIGKERRCWSWSAGWYTEQIIYDLY